MLWRRAWQMVFRLRFVWLQAILLAATAWVLWPLRDASALPNPPWPEYTPAPPDLQESISLGPTLLTPGTQGATRVIVADPRSGAPLPDARVRVSLAPRGRPDDARHLLYEGSTDGQGTVSAAFDVPQLEDIEWDLVIDIAGRVGKQRIVRPAAIRREMQIELATDRLAYHPGQTLHLMLRALDGTSALPLAGRPVTSTVYDARDTLICQDKTTTSDYGVALSGCRLADGAGLGAYRVMAEIGGGDSPDHLAERQVEVKAPPASHWVLSIETDERYALAGQPITGIVKATHPWGQPLAGASVALVVQDGVRQEDLARQGDWGKTQGETDASGAWRFALDVGTGWIAESNPHGTLLRLSALVTDAEGRTQETETWLPAASQPLLVQVEAESGALKQGLDNLIHAQVAYPDGRPAACTLTVEAPGLERPEQIETDAEGRAQWSYRPPDGRQSVSLIVTARDAHSAAAWQEVELAVSPDAYVFLIRPDRQSYRPGQTAHLDLLLAAPQGMQLPGAAYLDVVHEGQMVAAYAAPLDEGRAALDLPLADEWSGAVALHAYSFLPEGAPVIGMRQVALEPSDALTVSVQTDRSLYAPGDTARLSIQVTGPHGAGAPSSLVTAMGSGGQQRPEPAGPQRYESAPPLHTQQGTSTVARAGTIGKARPTPERVIQAFDAVASTRAARRQAFTALAGRLIPALVAVAVVACIAALGSARGDQSRESRLGWRGLVGRALGGLIVLPLLGAGAALLAYGMDNLFGPGAILVLGLSWLGASLALLAYAWQRRDGWAQVLWASTIGVLALGAGLRHALAHGAQEPPGQLWAGLAALSGAALASYVLAATLARRGERGGAGAIWALLVTLLISFAGAFLGGIPPQPGRPDLDAQASSDSAFYIAGPGALDLEALGAGLGSPMPSPVSSWTVGPEWTHGPGDWAYWAGGAVTDEQGRVAFDVPVPEDGAGQPDWLVSVAAWDGEGGFGVGQARLNLSRPLWVKTSLPAALTIGDELDLPIEVYNNSSLSQTILITATQASWFNTRVRGGHVGQVEVAGYDMGVFTLPIRVREWGRHRLEVVAQDQKGRYDLSQEVDVRPGGLRVWRVYDGQLAAAPRTELPPSGDLPAEVVASLATEPDEPPETRYRFRVPWSAVQGSERVTVTLYPNWDSVLAESLGAMDARRGGAATAPAGRESLNSLAAAIQANALLHTVLETGRAPSLLDREAGDRVRAALESGYQRLLTFEAAGGGFSPLTQAPPDVYHTALALSCLSELARLLPVDQALIERTAQWLYQEQTAEGTWLPAHLPPSWQVLPRPELPATAYAAWSLVEAGYGDAPEVRLALEHLARYPDKAQDPYVLALAIQALAADAQARSESPHGEALAAAVDLLAEMAEIDGVQAVWYGEVETFSGATGDIADTERTALAVYALLRTQRHPQLAEKGLNWLAGRRDGTGLWGPDTANWLAARTLLAATLGDSAPFLSSTVSVTVDEIEAAPLAVRSAGPGEALSREFDVLSKGYNDIVLTAEGIGPVPYRVVGTYVLPWDQVEPSLPEEEEISIEVRYDRTEAAVGETITATVDVMLNRPGVVPLAVLELGLPPGLAIVERQWEEMVARGLVAGYWRDGEQMTVHLAGLSAEQPVRLTYSLRARFPLWVRTLPTRAYDAANPGRAAVREPVRIEVLRSEAIQESDVSSP